LSAVAAEIVVKEIAKKPGLVLLLPTGKTPKGLYRWLVDFYQNKIVNFSKISVFGLDEYYPLKRTDRRSFYFY
jgi:glucosamine-6-phosphate deaminase